MYVVVVGSREWQGPEAEQQVNQLLDELRQKYSGLVIVTSSSDKGIGSIVRARCLRDKKMFQLVDIHVRVFAQLPRTKLAQVFFARNSALAELGEEFHIYLDPTRKGTFEDLIEKLEGAQQKRPIYKHLPIPSVVPTPEVPLESPPVVGVAGDNPTAAPGDAPTGTAGDVATGEGGTEWTPKN